MIKRRKKKTSSSKSSPSWMKSGGEIFKESERIAIDQKSRADARKRTGGVDPNRARFWLKPGESREIVILDDTAETRAFYEHNLKIKGKFGNHEACPGEWETCPLCADGDNSSYIWFLSILDLTPYKNRDGKTVPFTRRLLCIQPRESSIFKGVFKAAQRENGGMLRGTYLKLTRDEGDRTPRSGIPAILEDTGKMYDLLDESLMEENFSHPPIKDGSGTVMVKKNGLLVPFDYDALFTKPSAKMLAKKYGLSSPAGSDEDFDDLVESDGNSDEDEVIPFRDRLKTKKGKGTKKKTIKKKTWSSLGKEADAGDEDAAARLAEAAEEQDMDADDYATWRELGVELDDMHLSDEEEDTPTGSVRDRLKKRLQVDDEEEEEEDEPTYEQMGEQVDDGDDEWEPTLTAAAEAAGIDINDYPTWVELGVALDDMEEADEEEDEEDEIPF